MKFLYFLFYITSSCCCYEYTFPINFRFGVADNAKQVEDVWSNNVETKNIIDQLTQAKQDVQLLNNLGVNFYRFSISWSKILPSGTTDHINPDGVRYYNALINELLANEVTPLVLMFQGDLPRQLEDLGGFLNPEIANYFEDYADVLFRHFGDRVKEWITFNEPNVFCYFDYDQDLAGDRSHQREIDGFLCGRTLLIAHAKAYHLYNQKYRTSQKGRIGIANNFVWFEPLTKTIRDLRATDAAREYFLNWFIHPIFSQEGDYPQYMKGSIEYESKIQGYSTSKLPAFTDEEINMIKGTADFLGINHFITYYCTPIDDGNVHGGLFHFEDVDATCMSDQILEDPSSLPSKSRPHQFRTALKWIRDQYDNPEVIITENGLANASHLINDCDRIKYHNSYLFELLKAIHEDECNVTAYAAWSFLDKIEWKSGYLERSGLYAIDFNDLKLKRSSKMSACVYKKIIEDRRINWTYTPIGFPECQWIDTKVEL